MATPLPVIVGFGGVNPAGRVSFHHAYRRSVIDVLDQTAADDTYASLARLMNIDADSRYETVRKRIRDGTLVRRIECFDPDRVYWQRRVGLEGPDAEGLAFSLAARDMPDELPDGWHTRPREDGRVEVSAPRAEVLLGDRRRSRVSSAGQAPTGFEPGKLYASRSHPRGLQLAVYAASDAVQSIGIDWQALKNKVRPDQFAAYSGSAMGQLDNDSNGGMMQAPLLGRRPTSKQAALGLCEMPADFVNAYVIGSLGATGGVIGACATFLYNLKNAVNDIREGRCRVAVVGSAEAPIVPEIVEAYRTMGALAEDAALMAIDGSDRVDNRRACRPFAENCGFTLAEAGVSVVLFDDALALELGADIHAAVADVFINADGFKKSIPGPGVGNYVTVAKALALGRAICGEDGVRQRSCVYAHGTGTPQNRVTESHILNGAAQAFGIERWNVAAIKAYLGHTLAPASGDQIAFALGAWQHGWLPGIATIDEPADDVHHSHLRISPEPLQFDPQALDLALVNSKGFGGNNATGVLLAPHVAKRLMAQRYGGDALAGHARRNEAVHAAARDYDARATAGRAEVIYRYDDGVLGGDDLLVTDREIRVPGYGPAIPLDMVNPYIDTPGGSPEQAIEQARASGDLKKLRRERRRYRNHRFWSAVLDGFKFSDPNVEVPQPPRTPQCYVAVPQPDGNSSGLRFAAWRGGNFGCYLSCRKDAAPPARNVYGRLLASVQGAADDVAGLAGSLPKTLTELGLGSIWDLEHWKNSADDQRIGFSFDTEFSGPLVEGTDDFRTAVAWMRTHFDRLVSGLYQWLQDEMDAERRRAVDAPPTKP